MARLRATVVRLIQLREDYGAGRHVDTDGERLSGENELRQDGRWPSVYSLGGVV